ncbi:general secretion pathway protein B [Acidovorax sp. 69]|uniref:general secretion pathway protein GspB n=1 Tax=Acidovorax sp. 69 TaxID=2035202 RepID=UPI000C24915D|nr:general secretion pathway protein GspB [Acidovorax sp. 69]PJI99340.1 general secretion pathway protein B [Acidovorax sp. 69]
MSYILDALRRAEAERGRGAVPGLHTQVVPVPGAAPVAARSVVAPLLVVVTLVAVAGVAAAGAWWMMQRNAPGAGGVVAATSVSPSPSPLSGLASPVAAPVAAPPAALAPAAVPSPAAPSGARPLPGGLAPAEQREKPAAVPTAQRALAAEAARSRAAEPARDTAAVARVVIPKEPTPTPAPAVAAPTGTVFAQADLPEAVRAQLPSLKISGVTYSSNPVYRMAIVNGQVLHEGDPAGPGLLLEKIEPGRTIWSFKGYRYGLASQ